MEVQKVIKDELRQARHAMRGRLNALKLCISALPTCDTAEEQVEFLEQVELATDKLVTALDEYEAVQAARD